MAIQHHPLSNAALGSYLGFEHIGGITIFNYEHGSVELTCPDSAAWKWRTQVDNVINPNLIEGTNDNPIIDQMQTMHPSDEYAALRLDQQSIDGMDDMAFGTELGSSIENADYKEWCKHQDELVGSSEADETSINNYSSSINCHEDMQDNREDN